MSERKLPTIYTCFPGGKHKVLTMSYDDGNLEDRRLISIFNKYGISLPHHAASQAQMGTKVSLTDAQPGDLVFYAKYGKINHVAIYIGGGQVVHASSPKTGIKISSVNYRTPAGVRRYL